VALGLRPAVGDEDPLQQPRCSTKQLSFHLSWNGPSMATARQEVAEVPMYIRNVIVDW